MHFKYLHFLQLSNYISNIYSISLCFQFLTLFYIITKKSLPFNLIVFIILINYLVTVALSLYSYYLVIFFQLLLLFFIIFMFLSQKSCILLCNQIYILLVILLIIVLILYSFYLKLFYLYYIFFSYLSSFIDCI